MPNFVFKIYCHIGRLVGGREIEPCLGKVEWGTGEKIGIGILYAYNPIMNNFAIHIK